MLGEFGVKNTGYVQWLQELSRQLAIKEAVRFTGPLLGDRLARTYAASDLFINLGIYHRENFGLAQAEAQSCGIPVICSDWGGFKEVVRHGETGYRVDTVLTKNGIRVDWRTASRYATRCLRDSALRLRLGQTGLEWARSHFSCSVLANRLRDVIEKTSSDGRSDDNAYAPSEFAQSLEAHKKECGWYDPPHPDSSDEVVRWYPRERRMYQGQSYDLYRTIISPYASYDASTMTTEDVSSDWIPYTMPWVKTFAVQRLIQDNDPVWPARHYLTPDEWTVPETIDGVKTVEQLERDIPGSVDVLRGLHEEGVLIFQKSLR